MSIYELPKFKGLKIDWKKIKEKTPGNFLILVILLSLMAGTLAGFITGAYFFQQIKDELKEAGFSGVDKIVERVVEKDYTPQTSQEMKIISTVEKVSPAVVSIIVTKDLAIIVEYFENPFEGFEQFFGQEFEFKIPRYRQEGTEKQQVGGGTGFIVSADGMILTNKHVVMDKEADYTVLTNDGQTFPAKVLAIDPLQDIAILKIDGNLEINERGQFEQDYFTVASLGDSSQLQIGQTVIAIGNALGEFRNTVSVGVISGLGRTVTASGGGLVEVIEDVIQTDAAINRGNSGGPLLNLKGEVIGINTAMAIEAENIGFAIPIDKAKRDIDQVKAAGKIVYPFLGVRYILINKDVQKEYDLAVDYGVLIISGEQSGNEAIFPGSAADKIGLEEGDIILEFNGERITMDNSLAKIIQKYEPGDRVSLKVLRDNNTMTFQAILGEMEE